MKAGLELVHDHITPHLNKIATAFSRPIVIRVPAPLSVQLRILREARAKERAPAALAEKPKTMFRSPFPRLPSNPVCSQHLSPFHKEQMDRAVRAEIERRIRNI